MMVSHWLPLRRSPLNPRADELRADLRRRSRRLSAASFFQNINPVNRTS